jgi:hypothetical protein
MSGQHTPGPWQVNGSHVYGGGSPERASLIAQVLSPDPRHLADRSLIAAAPDLYEALRAALACHGREYSWGAMAEAALAKARGEA